MYSEFVLPSSPELEGSVELTPDSRAVMLREIQEQMFAFHTVADLLAKGKEVPLQLAHSVLSLAESRTVQLCKLTGIELDTSKEREERYAGIRRLNERVRELQLEIGKTGTALQATGYVKNMHSKLRAWWDKHGFGHISEFNMNEYGTVHVKFSCSLFGVFRMIDSDTPVSDKTNLRIWHESLRQRGFVLRDSPGDKDPSVVDCDQNRTALTALICGTFPSAVIRETNNLYDSRGQFMMLRDVTVFIRNLQDIADLPDAAE